MAEGTRVRTTDATGDRSPPPEISSCECSPRRTVFIESGNTDGWIASDLTVEANR